MPKTIFNKTYIIIIALLSIEILLLSYSKNRMIKNSESENTIIQIYKDILRNEKISYFPLVKVKKWGDDQKYIMFSEADYRENIILLYPNANVLNNYNINHNKIIELFEPGKKVIIVINDDTMNVSTKKGEIYYLSKNERIEGVQIPMLFYTKNDGEIIYKYLVKSNEDIRIFESLAESLKK